MSSGSKTTPGVVATGAPLGEGRAVVILLHGRNASAENILELAPRLNRPRVTFLAPSAPRGSGDGRRRRARSHRPHGLLAGSVSRGGVRRATPWTVRRRRRIYGWT